jgi:hypothetical protein
MSAVPARAHYDAEQKQQQADEHAPGRKVDAQKIHGHSSGRLNYTGAQNYPNQNLSIHDDQFLSELSWSLGSDERVRHVTTVFVPVTVGQ